MTCEEVRRLLGAFYDNEISDVLLSQRIQGHLETCSSCTKELEALRHVAASLRAAPQRFKTPEGLEARVRETTGIGTIQETTLKPAVRSFGFASALMYLAATLLGALIFVAYLQNRSSGRIEESLVADHVRSLQADHLFDVPSSDHHTVKPWFQGRIDFSPSVPDLAAQGFPLLGGRLDYLEGQPAAALVYGRAKHVINVLVTHHAKPDLPDKVEDRDGFHVIAWTSGGLDYWAVSDVNAADLQAFRAAFIASP